MDTRHTASGTTTTPIYTIGHGNRSLDEFVAALAGQEIGYLIDVRSAPFAHGRPDFSKDGLERALRGHGIRYVYLGHQLGGKPADPALYDDDRPAYERVRRTESFQEGLARVRRAFEQQLRVALMCSEARPEACHRTHLIGAALADLGIPVLHIDEQNRLRSQADVVAGREAPPPVSDAQLAFLPDDDWEPPDEPFEEPPLWLSEPPPATVQPATEAQASARPPRTAAVAPAATALDPTAAARLLKSVFGYDEFRPLQEEVIANLLAGRDSLAIMPTGSGKSLCYQLPALLWPGLTVVVSPLISLMKDQVDQLKQMGVAAAFLNSSLEYAEYGAIVARVRRGEIKLLYTSPETLLRGDTLALLDQIQVNCLAIDEAHCISAWGHDFRPEYRRLQPVRQRYPAAVCAAFTATATPRVQSDIAQMLGMAEANTFIASFDRPNLALAAEPRTNGLAQVLSFLAGHRGQSGIIYCSTRERVETLTAQLAASGYPSLPYHAGLDDDTRRINQERFARDEVPIIVATIAFGMGINKSNVRFIVHHNLPESIESYYQEIGRAGRDGLRSDCLLLYSGSDRYTINHFIEMGAAAEQQGRRARLQAMVRYAEAQICRRTQLLRYFGEEQEPQPGCTCDICTAERGETPMVDATENAHKLLNAVLATGQVFGAGHLIEVLRGARTQKVLARGHERLPVYGTGRELSANQWQRLAAQLVTLRLLDQDMAFGGLRLTDAGRAALRSSAAISVPAERPGAGAGTLGGEYDGTLFEKLRELRRVLADEAGVPPYVVFSDRTLVEMATYYPRSSASFLALNGVGERKLAAYGGQFLALIDAYCVERNLAEKPRTVAPGAAASPRPVAGGRALEVGRLFAAGQEAAAIQAQFGFGQRTLVEHLYSFVQSGQALPAERVRELSGLNPADQERALAAFAENGTERLKPVFEALGESISYDELHIMRVYYLCRNTARAE